MQQKTVELAMPRRRRKPIEQRTQECKLRAGLTTEADDSGGEATAESMRDEESGGRFGKLEQADGLRWMGPRVGSRVVCGPGPPAQVASGSWEWELDGTAAARVWVWVWVGVGGRGAAWHGCCQYFPARSAVNGKRSVDDGS